MYSNYLIDSINSARSFAGIIALCFFFICNNNAYAHPNNVNQNEKLYWTTKIWGFLKYYHPEVNKGKINWDSELINIIQKLPEAHSKEDLSELYVSWIKSLGQVPTLKRKESRVETENFDENFNLSWLDNALFTKELSNQLRLIENNRSKKLHYVKQGYVGQVEITNEINYSSSEWENPSIRLLILFRYWNVIEYFYPYKYKMDRSWDETLRYMIPRFMNVSSELDFHFLVNELTVSLCDSHAFFRTDLTYDYTGKKYIPADFKLIDNKAIITEILNDSLASLNDIRIGDAIQSVNHIPVIDVYRNNEKYIAGSNENVKKLNTSHRWIFNGSTDSVHITFERNGTIKSKTVARYNYTSFKSEEPNPIKWEKISNNIGYVNMEEGVLLAKDIPVMMKELRDTKAIIFDFRTYPEFIIDKLIRYLNSEPKKFAKAIAPDLSYPGRFRWTEPVLVGKQNPKAYKGRVIILVDENTQSRSEYFVMAMQTAERAVTVGRQTSGADGDVLGYTFFDNNMSLITGRGIYYPDGTETQRIGIHIDYLIPITIEDIRLGKDAVYEKAIEIAQQME